MGHLGQVLKEEMDVQKPGKRKSAQQSFEVLNSLNSMALSSVREQFCVAVWGRSGGGKQEMSLVT